MHLKKVLLIANPTSGRQTWKKKMREVRETLESHGWELDVKEPKDLVELREIAERGVEYQAAIVAGGDGTLSECLQVVPLDGPPWGVLPFGTANVLARDLGFSQEPVEAARQMVDAVEGTIDVASVHWPDETSRRSILSVSAGAAAEATVRVHLGLKKVIGRAAYAVPIIQAIDEQEPMTVKADGEELQGTLIFGLLTKHFAGDFIPNADAVMGDGTIDLYVMSGRHKAFLELLNAGRKGAVSDLDFVEFRKVKSFELPNEGALDVDGDSCRSSPVKVDIAGKLKMLRVE